MAPNANFSLTRRAFLNSAAAASVAAAIPASTTRNLFADDSDADALSAPDAPRFLAAVPVWADAREKEMNVTLRFTADVDVDAQETLEGLTLRVTASSIMRARINGEIACYGPARGPKGWFRVDEWKVGKYMRVGSNRLELDVAGYNSVSYYLLSQPSFLQAELVDASGRVLAATAVDGARRFDAVDRTGVRIQKVQRHGWHRTFIEAYDLTKEDSCAPVLLARRPDVPLLPRRVDYPELNVLPAVGWLQRGKLVERENYEPWRGGPLTQINDNYTGYKLNELELILTDELGRYRTRFNRAAKPLDIGATYHEGDVQIVDFGADYAGFWGFELETSEGAEFAISFDEILTKEGDVNYMRCSTCNAIKWTLPGKEGVQAFESFDPHAARYVKLYCLKGSFTLRGAYMREYAHPRVAPAAFETSDEHINKVWNAAVLTFRSNAVDVFSDCPHRERAGWLCDSFFTSRVAFDLTGRAAIESALFENYRLPESFPNLPKGALPMCYPADTWHGQFIPNWMMWFVVELKEYLARTDDRATAELLRPRITEMFRFFAEYENSDGLLEKLPNRVFVEWSDANKFLQDVNYPTNMLYAAALDAAGQIYASTDGAADEWRRKAETIRAKIREQAYNGEFFVDHAVRKEDGTLEVLADCSEVCQYFAFFFKTASPETYPELWSKLLDEFGPKRVEQGGYPDVKKANSFVGNVVRMELLSAAGRSDQILDESVAYNEYMADQTGTLWENATSGASCNHGFASHIAHVFHRDVLGVREIAPAGDRVVIRAPELDRLEYASGTVMLPSGPLTLRWEKKDGKAVWTVVDAPEGCDVVQE